MEKKALLIANPVSGKGMVKTHIFEVLDELDKGGYTPCVHLTHAAGDATRIAREYGADYDTVVVMGGDGTLSEVAAGLIDLENPPKIGYIALGTTNDVARTFGLPNTLYIYLVLIVVFWFIAKYTVFGRRSYMVGGNQDAARLMGINVEKHLIILHIITSAVTGFVGFLTASQVGAALPNSSSEFGFDVISAAVLGGVSIAGGKGSPLYSVLGVLILAILDNGLIILNVSTYWQLVVSGLILLFAVTLDSVKNMQAAKKY